MLDGKPRYREDDLLPNRKLVKIHPGLFEQPKPGDIKVFQIIPVPYHLQRVQIMKGHTQFYLVAHIYPANSICDTVFKVHGRGIAWLTSPQFIYHFSIQI
jgi:hypothetical protein